MSATPEYNTDNLKPAMDFAVGGSDHEKGAVYDNLPPEQRDHISLGAVLQGNATHELNLFERKAALVNAETDKFGFGKYQKCIWFLCGFGYFLDLCWVQGVGFLITAIYQEFGIPSDRQGLIFTCSNTGLAIGAVSFGIISDIIGRKWAFNITCLITSVFGMLLAASLDSYAAICGIYFLACVGLGGNIPIDATIALEFMPQNRRFLVPLLSMWQPIGVVAATLISFGTAAKYRCKASLPACSAVDAGVECCTRASNMGWRYQCIITGCITLTIFFLRFLVFTFHESPKFLVSKGREAEAIEVLKKIAIFNGAPEPQLTLEDFRQVDRMMGVDATEQAVATGAKDVFLRGLGNLKFLKGIFSNKLQMISFVLLAIAYMGDYWSFNLAGHFLPIVLLNNNIKKGGNSVTDTYAQYIYIYLPGVLGAIFAVFSVQLPLFGRKWSLVLSAILQGVAMAMYTQVRTSQGYVGLNALEYIMQTYFNAVLYASAPEMFDTTYRASASGLLSCLGRVAGIVAPFAGQQFLSNRGVGVLWLGAGAIWISAFFLCFLPIEMRNRQVY